MWNSLELDHRRSERLMVLPRLLEKRLRLTQSAWTICRLHNWGLKVQLLTVNSFKQWVHKWHPACMTPRLLRARSGFLEWTDCEGSVYNSFRTQNIRYVHMPYCILLLGVWRIFPRDILIICSSFLNFRVGLNCVQLDHKVTNPHEWVVCWTQPLSV